MVSNVFNNPNAPIIKLRLLVQIWGWMVPAFMIMEVVGFNNVQTLAVILMKPVHNLRQNLSVPQMVSNVLNI